MSIYIHGIEMPTIELGVIPVIIFADGSVENLFSHEKIGKAMPVPEHGRLGDLDAAVEKLKKLREYHSDDSKSGVFIAHGISQCIDVLSGRETPTIIPADPPVMEYPQVPGITPTVIAEEGEG